MKHSNARKRARHSSRKPFKIIVEKHPDDYVAYPLGLKGVVVGQGDTYEEAMADVKSFKAPRIQRTCDASALHPLVSVVVTAMMAVLADAGGPTAITTGAKLKTESLLKVLDLPNGIPRQDVFRRVLSLLKPDAFQQCFVRWLQALRQRAAEATGVNQPIFAVDGKTARRSQERKKGRGALHSVSVWASEFGLSLGQAACAEKSNEITAIPELLRLVDIKDTIITIDARGTQQAIAAQIIDSAAAYVLAWKGN